MKDFNSNGRMSTTQTVAYTDTAGTSSAVGSQTRRVRVVVTSIAFVLVGDGTATTANATYMPLGWPEVYDIAPGETVSAIQLSTGGNLHITELT